MANLQMVNLGTLLRYYNAGFMNISIQGDKVAIGAGDNMIDITPDENATKMVTSYGWSSYYLKPYDLINKTQKFFKAFPIRKFPQEIVDNAFISFENQRANDVSGHIDTYDRIIIDFRGLRKAYTIIYNMPKAGSKYQLYETGRTALIKRSPNLKGIFDAILADSGIAK